MTAGDYNEPDEEKPPAQRRRGATNQPTQKWGIGAVRIEKLPEQTATACGQQSVEKVLRRRGRGISPPSMEGKHR